MARPIGLVAAPRARRGGIVRARDQFDPSPLFRRARDYCERQGMEWYILSATHHLLSPQQVIGDDRAHVRELSVADRARWVSTVVERLSDLRDRSGDPVVFVLYTGQVYVSVLLRKAPHLPFETPLAGLDFVGRLRWFDERLEVRSRLLRPPGD